MRRGNNMKDCLLRPCLLLCCGALAAAIARFPAKAQEPLEPPPKETVSENAASAAKFAAAEALRYKIHPADSAKETLKLLAQPVLRWSNSTDGEVHGSVVFWTRHGCPEAAASIYQLFHLKQINIELVSLSEAALSAKRNDRVRWTPEPGVKFAPLPDAPAPADTAKKRQLQMRSLARRFTAAIADREDDTKFSVLRLMAKPLHQYESSDDAKREGAVFAFVTTTDPEVLLIIESRETASSHEWLYAAARMHFLRLQLKLGDKVVWDVPQAAPPWDRLRGPEGNYVILEWPSVEAAAKD
jgi:hypothetical protein